MSGSRFSLRRLLGIALSAAYVSVATCHDHWVDIWASMPQQVEPYNLPNTPYNGTDGVFYNTTIRTTVYLTQNATTIRLQFSNAYGASDLPITSATVALPVNNTAGSPAIRPSTLQHLTFSGSRSFQVPSGASSSPTRSASPSKPKPPSPPHHRHQPPNASTNGFSSPPSKPGPPTHSSLAIIGDSITDGRGSTTNLNNRWPDQLLARLRNPKSFPFLRTISLANLAAGGNRILTDGLGPSALSRLDRDVLSHSNVRYALIFTGVNDLGTAASDPTTQTQVTDRMIAAYSQMITRLHGAGIAVFGATITPMSGPGQAYGTRRGRGRGRG
ncbi:hypothetical protein N0V88_004030 [Collariella sp. IMI 366227]|nr:hypothetical protein N0V88_004030 [Collariella sp. IMI 366227]